MRGLDYYMRTAFEVLAPNLGAQNAVGGGGRYDGLVEALGGPAVAGIGFALGVERMIMAAGETAGAQRAEIAVIPLTEAAASAAFQLARQLRLTGCAASSRPGRSVKSAMRRADKMGARYAILLGDDELRAGRATLRDLRRQTDHRLAVALDASGPALATAIRDLGEHVDA